MRYTVLAYLMVNRSLLDTTILLAVVAAW